MLAFLLPSLMSGVTFAQTPTAPLDRFIGIWTEDESKRDMSGASLTFRQGAKSVEELRGGDVSPVAQPVIFDGKTQVIDADTSIAWRQIDANSYERKLTSNGKLRETRTLTLSSDGKILTEKSDVTLADGRPRTVTSIFQRVDGQTGLVGRWKAQSVKSTVPALRKIERVGANGIKLTTAIGTGFTATLDGKPAPSTGAGVITGTMNAVRLTGDRTLQITISRNSKDTNRNELVLSADGKTLTETNRSLAPNAGNAASVLVFTKQ
jgi:hypothetical protein